MTDGPGTVATGTGAAPKGSRNTVNEVTWAMWVQDSATDDGDSARAVGLMGAGSGLSQGRVEVYAGALSADSLPVASTAATRYSCAVSRHSPLRTVEVDGVIVTALAPS
jgi:hypothetical protein